MIETLWRSLPCAEYEGAASQTAPCPPRDLEGQRQAFVANLPDDGAMFAPEVVRCDGEGLDIKFHRCPLK
jgi:hypothetical protein